VGDDVIRIAVEQVTAGVLDALARDEAPTSIALRFLLRAYAATGRDDLRDAIEPALARALELSASAPVDECAGWLLLFAEAAEASGDDRLQPVAVRLFANVRSTWGRQQRLDIAAAGIDACLRAIEVTTADDSRRDLIQSAIDELERIVAPAYQPGQGVSEKLSDQIAVASALLTAYQRTGRLPYSMLAEELMQSARRGLWDDERGAFVAGVGDVDKDKPFTLNCEAVVVLCRLAALHRAADYREAAVIAPGADYDDDAARILQSLAVDAPERGLAGAIYAFAAAERQSVL